MILDQHPFFVYCAGGSFFQPYPPVTIFSQRTIAYHFDLVQFCSWQFTGQVKVQMYSFCASAVQWSYTPSPPTSSLSHSDCCSTFIVSIPTPLGFRNRCLNIYLLYIPLETWVFWRCNRRATQPHQRTSIKGHSGVWMDGALESDPGSQRSTVTLITSPLMAVYSDVFLMLVLVIWMNLGISFIVVLCSSCFII